MPSVVTASLFNEYEGGGHNNHQFLMGGLRRLRRLQRLRLLSNPKILTGVQHRSPCTPIKTTKTKNKVGNTDSDEGS